MGCIVVLEALILVIGLPLSLLGVGVFFVDFLPNIERACVVVGSRVNVTSGSTGTSRSRRTNLWLRMIMM